MKMLLLKFLAAEQAISGTYGEILEPIRKAIAALLSPALILVATAGSIYAVYLGVIMAKAEDQGKRDEAKKRVINAVLALVVIVVLILLLQLFIDKVDTLIAYENCSK